ALAAQSPGRQWAFRGTVVAHLLLLAAAAAVLGMPEAPREMPGHLLLIAGIVEGAVLIGWRLAEPPQGQAPEFLLPRPPRPARGGSSWGRPSSAWHASAW